MEISKWQPLGKCTAVVACVAFACSPLRPLQARNVSAPMNIHTVVMPSCVISHGRAGQNTSGVSEIAAAAPRGVSKDTALFVVSCWGADRPAVAWGKAADGASALASGLGGASPLIDIAQPQPFDAYAQSAPRGDLGTDVTPSFPPAEIRVGQLCCA